MTRESRTASQVSSLPRAGKGILAETPWMEQAWQTQPSSCVGAHTAENPLG